MRVSQRRRARFGRLPPGPASRSPRRRGPWRPSAGQGLPPRRPHPGAGPGAAWAPERSAGRCRGVLPGAGWGWSSVWKAGAGGGDLWPRPLPCGGRGGSERAAGAGDRSKRLTRLAARGAGARRPGEVGVSLRAPQAQRNLDPFSPALPRGRREPRLVAEISENAQWLAARLPMSAHLGWNPKSSAFLCDPMQLFRFSVVPFFFCLIFKSL